MHKNNKIVHKKFQLNYDKGGIEVQLNFVINEDHIEIANINIHSSFESGLPNSATLDKTDGIYYLVASYFDLNGRKIIERMNNKYAEDIVNEILKIQKQI